MNTVLLPSFYFLLLVYGFEWIGSLGHTFICMCVCMYIQLLPFHLCMYDRFHQIHDSRQVGNLLPVLPRRIISHTTLSCSIGFVGTVLSSHDNGAKRG